MSPVRSVRARLRSERGAVLVIIAASMVGLMGMAALVIDIGYLLWIKTKLQATADGTALAAAQELPDEGDTQAMAVQYVVLNEGDATPLGEGDVVTGHWNSVDLTFEAGGVPKDAVQVTVERSEANGNPVSLWFARVLGIELADVGATAIAVRVSGGPARFLIDQEMIDNDIKEIEDLAAKYGMTPEEMISDNDGDWFIDIPVGEELTLPTGQEGDVALFDMNHPSFPFNGISDPTLTDFLNFNEDGSWRQELVPKDMLDPLIGVLDVEDGSLYPSFVSPDCQVSPVYKNDISNLNDQGGDPAVNALGFRRGLLAYKIIGVGEDPDGSVLPTLIIEICAPIPLDQFEEGVRGGVWLVQ
jgi:hypothetical protein